MMRSIRSVAPSFCVVAVLAASAPTQSAPMRAEEVWARTQATYAALQSYADTGTVDVELGSKTATIHEVHTFSTFFRKPRDYQFDFVKSGGFDRIVVWGNADGFHGWWKATGVQTDYAKGNGASAFISSTYPTHGSIVMLAPLLFPGAGLIGTLTELGAVADGGTEKVDGHQCHKIVGVAKTTYRTGKETNVRRTTVWIDVESLLIRRVYEEAAEGTNAESAGGMATTFHPHANPTLNDKQLTFTSPSSH
jgi:hypothetical protein